MLDNIVIATVSKTHDEFSQKIAEFAGQTIDITDTVEPSRFSGGEFRPRYRVDLHEKELALIASEGPWQVPIEMLARTCLMAYSAKKHHGAKKVTAVMTELPFDRQDKDPNKYEKVKQDAFTAEWMAKILHASGVDRILTMHMHSLDLYDIFEREYKKPGRDVIYDISPHFILAYYLMRQSSLDISNGGEKVCFISPDQNARRFVKNLMNLMPLPNAVFVDFEKARDAPNNPDAVVIKIQNLDELKRINFTFEGKYPVFTDDKLDTGGTLIKTHNWIHEKYPEFAHGLGLPAGMYYYFTHPVLKGKSFFEIQEKLVKELPAIEYITTNTRPYIGTEQGYRFKERCTVLRFAALFADAILNCCEKNIHPDDYYKFDSFEELEKTIKEKGLDQEDHIKRSSRHLMKRDIDMVSTFLY